jgi:O-Antigen ligase
MTTTSLSGRVRNPGERTSTVLLTAFGCALGVFVGRLAISHYGVTAIEALIAIPALIALVPRPLAAVMLLLALVASVFSYTYLPRANLPGHPPLNVSDIVLLAAVGGTIWRRPWRSWPPPVRRFYAVLALLLVLALVPSIALALQGHAGSREAITGYKDLLYLSVALTVALELSGRLWSKLLGASIAFAAIVAVLSILGAVSGSLSNVLNHYDPGAIHSGTLIGATVPTSTRIRLPGLFFIYAMTIPTLVLVFTIKDRWRLARIAALCLMVGAIAVSLNRNMYFGGLVGVLVAVVLGGPRLRHRFAVTAIALVIALAIVVQSAVIPAVAAAVSKRAQSALSSQVLSSGSARDREDEFSHAFTSIAAHPFYGVGWYQPYGAYVGTAYRGYVEDWYLHLATDMGIPVALAFLLIPWVVIAYGLRRVRVAANPADRAMLAAGIATVVALLLSCLVGTYLQDPGSMAVFGVACGFLLAAGMRAKPAAALAPIEPGAVV